MAGLLGRSPAVPIVAALAGLLFATSFVAAKGTDLRGGRSARLLDLVDAEQRAVAAQTSVVSHLSRQVAGLAAAQPGRPLAAAQSQANALAGPAGLLPMAGPGLSVSLSDAPKPAPGVTLPGNPTPDDLVVHQQDVQAVVNALWAGGARAMTIMGKRIISTTAVKCVGNTLLLQGVVYSPPFVVTAIGDPVKLRRALDDARDVQIYLEYVAAYGLGYQVADFTRRTVPGYGGPLGLRYAS